MCDGTQPSKVARTTLEPGPASLAKSLPVKNVNPTCSVEGTQTHISKDILMHEIENFYSNHHEDPSLSKSFNKNASGDDKSNSGKVQISVKLVDANLPLKMEFPELLRNANFNSSETQVNVENSLQSTNNLELTDNSQNFSKNLQANSQNSSQNLQLIENGEILNDDTQLLEDTQILENDSRVSDEKLQNSMGNSQLANLEKNEVNEPKIVTHFFIDNKKKTRKRSRSKENLKKVLSKTNSENQDKSIEIDLKPAKRFRKLKKNRDIDNFANIFESCEKPKRKINKMKKKNNFKSSELFQAKGKMNKSGKKISKERMKKTLKKQISKKRVNYRRKNNGKREFSKINRSVAKLFALALYLKYMDARRN